MNKKACHGIETEKQPYAKQADEWLVLLPGDIALEGREMVVDLLDATFSSGTACVLFRSVDGAR